jgi:NADH:ubiquinone oxidoreductase subunit 6 (subunit J)
MNDVESGALREPNGGPTNRSAGIPRWVKVFVLVAAVVVLLMVVAMLVTGGQHGPGRHQSTMWLGDGIAASGVATDANLADAR